MFPFLLIPTQFLRGLSPFTPMQVGPSTFDLERDRENGILYASKFLGVQAHATEFGFFLAL
jgi:hypothetical protein